MKLPHFLSDPISGVARATAPVADGDTVPTDAGSILSIALDVGAEILRTGGEIHRVEDTVTRICYAYGAEAVEVFAITSLIIADVRMPDGSYATHNRRVSGTYNHLSRLEALNALSRKICESPISASEVAARLADIRRYRPLPAWLCYIGGILATSGFTLFFGGSWKDALASGVIGLLLTLFSRLLPLRINNLVKSLISSLGAGLLSVLFVSLGLGDSIQMIIIGTIMLEIPGVAFGISLRDLLGGDTLAGTMRSIQAIIQALMVALGYLAALVLLKQQIAEPVDVAVHPLIVLLTAALGTVGFAIIYYVHPRHLVFATLGGILTCTIYLLSKNLVGGELLPNLLGAMAGAVFCEVFARLTKTPVPVYMLPAIIPLIPGGTLYRTMFYFAAGSYAEAASLGITTLQAALGIAGGIVIASVIGLFFRPRKPVRKKN